MSDKKKDKSWGSQVSEKFKPTLLFRKSSSCDQKILMMGSGFDGKILLDTRQG